MRVVVFGWVKPSITIGAAEVWTVRMQLTRVTRSSGAGRIEVGLSDIFFFR
jgi:hypothetical protein